MGSLSEMPDGGHHVERKMWNEHCWQVNVKWQQHRLRTLTRNWEKMVVIIALINNIEKEF
jgi:hypothetical protein